MGSLKLMLSPFAGVAAIAVLAAGTFLVACSGVSFSGTDNEPMPEAGSTVIAAPTPGPSDAALVPALFELAPTDAAAMPYQGSPLCNASRSTGCCYPDDPTNAQACSQAACQTGGDGGPVAGGAFVEVPLGCHVGSTSSATAAADDASPPDASIAPVCLPGGQGLDGFPCLMPSDCAPGYECVGALPTSTCRHYCCSGNSSCQSVEFCDIQPTFVSSQTNVPVCMPEQPCPLLSTLTPCSDDQTCAVVRDDSTPTTSCVDVGPAAAGESCETEHCGRGLVCLGAPGARACYVLCHTQTAKECTSSQQCKGGLPLFSDSAVGICQ
jgi:hypothetical protein